MVGADTAGGWGLDAPGGHDADGAALERLRSRGVAGTGVRVELDTDAGRRGELEHGRAAGHAHLRAAAGQRRASLLRQAVPCRRCASTGPGAGADDDRRADGDARRPRRADGGGRRAARWPSRASKHGTGAAGVHGVRRRLRARLGVAVRRRWTTLGARVRVPGCTPLPRDPRGFADAQPCPALGAASSSAWATGDVRDGAHTVSAVGRPTPPATRARSSGRSAVTTDNVAAGGRRASTCPASRPRAARR